METLDQVRHRWCEGDNIGIACRASRIVGLDLDVDGDGAGSLAALACELGRDWPDAFAARTPSGRHLYFRVGPGCTVASVSGGRSRLGSGIDVRGPGRRNATPNAALLFGPTAGWRITRVGCWASENGGCHDYAALNDIRSL
ncbi:bifunctional DNA primase/polymerase [Nocardia sp. NPDC004711]